MIYDGGSPVPLPREHDTAMIGGQVFEIVWPPNTDRYTYTMAPPGEGVS